MQKTNRILFDEVYLKNYKDFIKVNNKYYGGDQRWLWEENKISKFRSDRSCGVIAACNTLSYILPFLTECGMMKFVGILTRSGGFDKIKSGGQVLHIVITKQ
ncbi:MAG TPA: hypothetical protein GX707_05200 [Epulopiscium sp.]|nr:hypothetical protein [Candidatus Epulonipiscium sp.]